MVYGNPPLQERNTKGIRMNPKNRKAMFANQGDVNSWILKKSKEYENMIKKCTHCNKTNNLIEKWQIKNNICFNCKKRLP